MKEQELKEVYSKAPQGFHNTVVRTLNSLEEKTIITVRPKSKIFRTAVACALILAIGAVGVVSAAAIYPMVANREGNYGMTLDFQTTGSTSAENMSVKLSGDFANAPEYVKMNFGYLPEGVIEAQSKYSLNGEHEEKCFSFVVERVAEGTTVSDDNILDYEQFEINGNPAVLAHVNNIPNNYTKRFYIFFEAESTFVMCYVSDDVSDDEIKRVMENISLTEGTAEDNDGGSLSEAKQSALNKAGEAFNEFAQSIGESYIQSNEKVTFTEISCGQSVGYSDEFDEEEKAFEYCVDSIELLDNISELDKENFDNNMFDLREYVDENGNLLPYTREIYSYGDGINTTNKIISSETMNRKLVYVTATVTNTSNKEQCFYLRQIGLERLRENNGELVHASELEENLPSEPWCLETNYIDNNDVDTKGFTEGYYTLDVPANSSKTVNLGFFADEDMLDELYVTFDATEILGIFDTDTNTFVKNNNPNTEYGYACIKVD